MHYTIASLLALALTLSVPAPAQSKAPQNVGILALGANGESGVRGKSNHVEFENVSGRLSSLTFNEMDGQLRLVTAVGSLPTRQTFDSSDDGDWAPGRAPAVFTYWLDGEAPVTCRLEGTPDKTVFPRWKFTTEPDQKGPPAEPCLEEIGGVRLKCDPRQLCAKYIS